MDQYHGFGGPEPPADALDWSQHIRRSAFWGAHARPARWMAARHGIPNSDLCRLCDLDGGLPCSECTAVIARDEGCRLGSRPKADIESERLRAAQRRVCELFDRGFRRDEIAEAADVAAGTVSKIRHGQRVADQGILERVAAMPEPAR